MVTIFKNLTNILIMFGDYYFYNTKVTNIVIGSFGIMLFGAICAAYNDVTFNAAGYFWMSMNCFATASYVLYMKFATKTIKISKVDMVFYNNMLSIPILGLLGALR